MVFAVFITVLFKEGMTRLRDVTETGVGREMPWLLGHDGADNPALTSEFLDICIPLGKMGIFGVHGLSDC